MFKKILKYLKSPTSLCLALSSKGAFNWMSDISFIKLRYYCEFGKKLNLQLPKTFNEKMQWLKLFDRNPKYISLVDKFLVREYIGEKIGKEYLIPLIGAYDSFDQIDFDELPNQFVLKCTHDSGGLVICTDKSKFDISKARKKINKCLKRSFFFFGREWPYKDVKPRIICEKFMVDEADAALKDYKFMCFNGEPRMILLCQNRHSNKGLNIDFYDANWSYLHLKRPNHPNSGMITCKPNNFNKMIEFSRKLSKDKKFVRIDFYETNGRLYFGEITFYPGSGFEKFEPEEYDNLLGSWINL